MNKDLIALAMGDERRASVQDAIKAMRNLGVSLNDYDSSALELLIQWSEDALSPSISEPSRDPY